MLTPNHIVRVASLKTPEAIGNHVRALAIELPCDDEIQTGASSPLTLPMDKVRINGKVIGNRCVVQPMEGWDATAEGGVTEDVSRRWQRFGQSGAKLIWGCEAMAVRLDARANPHQLVMTENNLSGLAGLRLALEKGHRDRFGSAEDLVVGFQLTHSGRFCRPHSHSRLEPRVAYRHPILDLRTGVTSNDQVLTDAEVERLVEDFVCAARVAWKAGADFIDIKHCHGYLLHEFLSAFHRPGKFGGSFENRTRILREIVDGIRADGNPIELGVRLSAFDFVPFRPDPGLSKPGQPGPGVPEDYSRCLLYQFGFGVNAADPVQPELSEPIQFLELCLGLGIKMVNLSAGSPYYNPHIQRPAAFPPSDGYLPPEDPLVGVARHVNAVRYLRSRSNPTLVLIGSGYSYLQEFFPNVAQAVVREGWTDMVGIGRMALSYPEIFSDTMTRGRVNSKLLCRTFSDCTTAPRNGLTSGCFPLDPHYSGSPAAEQLREIKRASRQGAAEGNAGRP